MNLESEDKKEIKNKNSYNANKLFLIVRTLAFFSLLEWLWYSLLAFSKMSFYTVYNKEFCENISERLYSERLVMERMKDKYYGSVYLISIILFLVFALYLVFMVTNYRLSKKKSPYLKNLLIIEIIILLIIIVIPCFLFLKSVI